MYVCMYVCMYVHVHVCMYVCMCTLCKLCMYVLHFVCIIYYVCMYNYVCIMCTYVQVHTHIYYANMYYWACGRIVCHKKAGKRKTDLHVQEMIIDVITCTGTEWHFMIAVKHLKIHTSSAISFIGFTLYYDSLGR